MRVWTVLTLVALVACLALTGCGAAKPATAPQTAPAATAPAPGGGQSIVGTAQDKAAAATCAANRAQLDQQYSIAQSGATGASVDFAALVQQLGVKCPSGGTYSWDAAANKTRCSIHGE